MKGSLGLLFAALDAVLVVNILSEIWFERMLTPLSWLTRSPHPRAFPIIVAVQVLAFLFLTYLAAVAVFQGL